LHAVRSVVVLTPVLAGEAIERALTKVSGENRVREEFAEGKSLRDVFDRYQIL
jgi:hypothetical protein